jgi:hypothetical protein
MWRRWGYASLCGAALLVALAGAGAAQEGATVEGAANTFAGILSKNKPDPRACLPGGGLSLLGVKHADVGMRGFARLRDDHPLRVKSRESYEEVQKQSAALSPVANKVEGLDSDIAFLQKEIPDKSRRIDELERQLASAEAGPGSDSQETPEQAKDRAERIVKLNAEIADEKDKLAQMRGKLSAAESEIGPARLERAKLEQSLKTARATYNADWKAADDTGNSCP